MMISQIKNRWSAAVIFECAIDDAEPMKCKAALRIAIERGANLHGADLSVANLHGANLRGANLPSEVRIARLDFGGWPVTARIKPRREASSA